MKLISCNNCAVVLDGDKLHFQIRDDDFGSIDYKTAAYCQDTGRYEAYINCPVCNEKVFHND